MKKFLTVSSFALFGVIALSSCKKDYTCACAVSGGTLNLEIKKAKKGDAESICNDAETTYKLGDPDASCAL